MLGQQPIVVAPGNFAEIGLEFITGKTGGPFEKDIAIITDSESSEYKLLPCKIVGEVIVPIKSVPDEIFLGTVDPGKRIERKLDVVIHDPAVLKKLKSIECSDPFVNLSTLKKTADTITLQVIFQNQGQVGSISTNIELTFDDPEIPNFNIPILGEVKGDIGAIPTRLAIKEKGHPKQFKVKVSSSSGQAFRITDVDCPEGIESQITAKEGDSMYYVLLFSVSPAEMSKTPEEPIISIATDNSQQETLVIPVEFFR